MTATNGNNNSDSVDKQQQQQQQHNTKHDLFRPIFPLFAANFANGSIPIGGAYSDFPLQFFTSVSTHELLSHDATAFI